MWLADLLLSLYRLLQQRIAEFFQPRIHRQADAVEHIQRFTGVVYVGHRKAAVPGKADRTAACWCMSTMPGKPVRKAC